MRCGFLWHACTRHDDAGCIIARHHSGNNSELQQAALTSPVKELFRRSRWVRLMPRRTAGLMVPRSLHRKQKRGGAWEHLLATRNESMNRCTSTRSS